MPPRSPSPLYFLASALFGPIWPNESLPFGLAYQTEQNSLCSAKQGEHRAPVRLCLAERKAGAEEEGAESVPESGKEMETEGGYRKRADVGEWRGAEEGGGDGGSAEKEGCWGRGRRRGRHRKGRGARKGEGDRAAPKRDGRGGDGAEGVERKG